MNPAIRRRRNRIRVIKALELSIKLAQADIDFALEMGLKESPGTERLKAYLEETLNLVRRENDL